MRLHPTCAQLACLLVGVVCVFASCVPRGASSRLALANDWEMLPPVEEGTSCLSSENQTPDLDHLDFWPIKTVRLGVHVVDRSSAMANFDSIIGPGRINKIIDGANYRFSKPTQVWLPYGNTTPIMPARMRYTIDSRDNDDGIYFHYDDEIPWHVHKGKTQNLSNQAAFNRYKYRNDTILNVFVLAHDPDSIASARYKNDIGGVAFGARFLKIVADWHDWKGPDALSQILMHETSHIYTLQHTWAQNDGCDDTPTHRPCWNYNYPPGCDSTNVSNNLLDYTAHSSALSPCQVGRMQAVAARENSKQRDYLVPNWCEGLGEAGNVELRDSFVLRHAADLEGNLTLHPGAYLEVRCRLSLPAGAQLNVLPGATLVMAGGKLHNSCNLPWQGVATQRGAKLLWHEGSAIEDAPSGPVATNKARS